MSSRSRFSGENAADAMGDATQAAYGLSSRLQTFPKWATLSLLLTLLIYLRGWRALAKTRPDQIPGWRAGCFAGGIAAVWIAIASPLDTLSGALLTAHMIQHLLLMSVAPPLLVLGAPVVPLLRGLPRSWVREGIGPFFTLRPVHFLERVFASRAFAWIAMNIAFLGWHVPAAYDLALASPGWHEVEHVCFLFTSVLFWWHIVAPWPTTYPASRWLLLPFLLSADIVNTGLSAALSFSGRVFYPAYARVPRFFGVSVLSDQVAAGSLMWVVGSMAFLGAAMLITVNLLSRRGERRGLGFDAARARLAALQPAAPPRLPKQPRRPFDLLRIRPIGAFLKSRYGRQSLQALSLLLAAAVIADGLFGHQMGSMNLAGIVPWTYGRGLFVLALLLVGNLFCMSCPFTLPREASKWLAARLGWRQLPWPRFLRNKWAPAALVVLFFWAYEALDLWNSPLRTAVLLLGYFAVTFAVDSVFRDASFCKYVCPLGQFNFVSSLLSPVGVAPRSLATCGGCATRDCIAGHVEPRPQRGCELHLFLPEKQGNVDCTLCMDCVKACPHDNIGLFAQPPALELARLATRDPQRSAVGRYRDRLDLAVIAATVIAAAFASAAVMVAPVAAALDRLGVAMNPAARTAAGLLAAFAIPAALLSALELARPRGERRNLPKWVLALLPLGLGMWAAHLSFHLATAWDSVVPGVLQAGQELAKAGVILRGLPSPDWLSEQPLLGPASLLKLQMGLLDAGFLGALYLGWRMAGAAADPGRRALAMLPWASVASGLYAAGVWILIEPMQMRGMVGM